MKKLLPLILLINSLSLFGQENDSTIQIIDPVESMPTFQGGDNQLWCFIESNLRYDIINFTSIKTRYFIRFTIDTVGYPKDFEFIATVPRLDNQTINDSLIRDEILRVLKLMPKWNPAVLGDGHKVWCRYVLPIRVPYTEFRCGEFKQDKNIDYAPDSLADFKVGVGQNTIERINKYLYGNLIWPSQMECTGKVVIKCVVEKSGELSNFEYILRLCPEFDDEALRVIKEMPKWTPAITKNKPVRSVVVITSKFKISP